MKDQEKLVVYLAQEEENLELDEQDRVDLTKMEQYEKNGLLLQYTKMGEEFPAFINKDTRENMQRIVVKVMGLC